MTREEFIQSAQTLEQPSTEASQEFEAAAEHIANELNKHMTARADLENLIGDIANKAMLEDNSRNFCRFMSANFQSYKPEVFVDTVLWVFRTYRSHGFNISFWPANVDTCVEIIREILSTDSFNEVYPFYKWIIVNIPSFTIISDSFVEPCNEDYSE
ncbi:MAG: hypothetical protein U5P10_11210 [Spirochaetia bacterium]|nr:hypothetical protein [Spirochaetia bacterium]